ncbi:hypothetical protein Tco_0948351 [Tanacetum coccineum]
MACSLPHTDDEVEALVQKLINEDMVRQKAIMDLALQFDNACTAKEDLRKAYKKSKEDLRKAYKKCNDIPKWDLLLLEEVKEVSVEKICDKKLNVLFTKPFDGPRFNYLVVSIGQEHAAQGQSQPSSSSPTTPPPPPIPTPTPPPITTPTPLPIPTPTPTPIPTPTPPPIPTPTSPPPPPPET